MFNSTVQYVAAPMLQLSDVAREKELYALGLVQCNDNGHTMSLRDTTQAYCVSSVCQSASACAAPFMHVTSVP